MIDSNAIPPHILPLMPKEDRPKGPAGMTTEEVKADCDTHSEKELQRQISQYLSMRDIPFSNSRMDKKTRTAKGNADFWVCFAGRCVTVECKMPGEQLKEKQERFKSQIIANGGIHITCQSLEQIVSVLRDVESESK